MRRGKEKSMCESECERDREREIVVVCERIVRGSEVFGQTLPTSTLCSNDLRSNVALLIDQKDKSEKSRFLS